MKEKWRKDDFLMKSSLALGRKMKIAAEDTKTNPHLLECGALKGRCRLRQFIYGSSHINSHEFEEFDSVSFSVQTHTSCNMRSNNSSNSTPTQTFLL